MVALTYTLCDDASTELVACPADCHNVQRCSSDDMESSPLAPAPLRRVTFLVDELDRDLVEVIEYELPPVETWCDLYWTSEEKSDFVNDARQHVMHVVQHWPGQIARLETAYYHCNSSGRNSSVADDPKDDMRALLLWAKSPERGLEDSVTPVFSNERRDYIHCLILYANALYEYAATNDIDVDQELRRYSEEQTRRSREFAYKMAIADDLVQ